MKTITMGLAAGLALAGCASSTPMEDSTGARTFHVDCVPGRSDLCYAKARQLCPDGYTEVKKDSSPTAALPPSPGGGAAADGSPTALSISCK